MFNTAEQISLWRSALSLTSPPADTGSCLTGVVLEDACRDSMRRTRRLAPFLV
jgi:hypothetical protein